MKLHILNRKIHFWGSAIVALPLLVVIVTGIILLLKKDIDWIQPPTVKTSSGVPAVSFPDILATATRVPEANITTWEDIDRLDVRPSKGIIKIRAKNSYEIQINHHTADIIQVAYRRSDLIEAIHDGSFFHDYAKYGLFLPSAVILLMLWITGMYLFIKTMAAKQKKKKKA